MHAVDQIRLGMKNFSTIKNLPSLIMKEKIYVIELTNFPILSTASQGNILFTGVRIQDQV